MTFLRPPVLRDCRRVLFVLRPRVWEMRFDADDRIPSFDKALSILAGMDHLRQVTLYLGYMKPNATVVNPGNGISVRSPDSLSHVSDDLAPRLVVELPCEDNGRWNNLKSTGEHFKPHFRVKFRGNPINRAPSRPWQSSYREPNVIRNKEARVWGYLCA